MADTTSKSEGRRTPIRSKSKSLSHLFGQSTRKSGLDANWLELDATVLLRLVWAIDYLGGAVTFSTTKNGGAYCVKVYIGAPYDPVYFDGDAEGREKFAAWVEAVVTEAAENA